jgi:hypothetical protein
MNIISKLKNKAPKKYKRNTGNEQIVHIDYSKVQSKFVPSVKTKEKESLMEGYSFFETLKKITEQLNKLSKFQISIIDHLEDGYIKFEVTETIKKYPTVEEFPTLRNIPYPHKGYIIKDYDYGGEVVENFDALSKVQKAYINSIQNKKMYIISQEEFDQYTESKLNSSFYVKWRKMIDLYKKRELEKTMSYLIPQYENSFTTILNVLNAHIDRRPDKQLSPLMETKILTIFESFEKKVIESENKKKELDRLEEEGFVQSLEELLDFEVKFIENNERVL